MSVLGVIQLVVLAGFSFALLVGAIASAGARFFLSGTASWSPERRHRALLLLGIAPLVLAAFGVVAVLAPSAVSLIWPEHDHCLSHGSHHLHICLVHLPHDLGNAGSWIVLLLLVGWLSLRAGGALTELYRAWRCASQLRVHGEGDPALGANILPTAAPLCILVGIFKPTLFLSRGLLARVDPEQVAVIVHHERAHAARRDILARLFARAGAVFMWPPARIQLLGALELAAEQSCDEVAAANLGDRLQVAEAILRVERLLQTNSPPLAPLAVEFGGNTVPERIASLLEAPRRSGSAKLLALGFMLLSSAVLAASGPLHHLTESLLETLVH
jgi:hypothetical protein